MLPTKRPFRGGPLNPGPFQPKPLRPPLKNAPGRAAAPSEVLQHQPNDAANQ